MDWATRRVLSWRLSNTLDTSAVVAKPYKVGELGQALEALADVA